MAAFAGWPMLASQIKGLPKYGIPGEAAVIGVALPTAALIAGAYRSAPRLRPAHQVRSTEF
jgi:hypothetical protein